jgi:hypothetical protein
MTGKPRNPRRGIVLGPPAADTPLARRVQALCEAIGQAELARRTGVSVTALHHWRNTAGVTPRPAMLAALARVEAEIESAKKGERS